jgi:hypothetical protein
MRFHIYPSAMSLLYFPVYLALEGLAKERGLSFQGRNFVGDSSWIGRELEITLHSATNSDPNSLELLTRKELEDESTVAVAVADALQLVTSDSPSYIPIATLISRAATWLVYREGNNGADSVQEYLRQRKDRPYGLPPKSLFLPEGVALGGLKLGFTNVCLAAALLNRKSFQHHATSFGDGEYQLMYAFKKCSLSLTSSPWLKEYYNELQESSERFGVIPLAPFLPLPYTAVITTKLHIDKGTQKEEGAIGNPIRLFLRHLLAAVVFSYRHPHLAMERLLDYADHFDWYGIPRHDPDGPDTKKQVEPIVRAAVDTAITNGLFCPDLRHSWTAWETALDLVARFNSENIRNDWYGAQREHINRWREYYYHSLGTAISDDQFWKLEYANITKSMMGM